MCRVDWSCFFEAEAVIRGWSVTGVQTCALPILASGWASARPPASAGGGGDAGERDDADTDAERESPLPPYIRGARDRPLEAPSDFFRLGRRTVFQECAEFVAAEAPDGVPAAQAAPEQAADHAEEAISGLVT